MYAGEKCDAYVYGREEVTMQTDHKSLESIFKKPMRLHRYNLKFVYHKGAEMYLADALSRAYLPVNVCMAIRGKHWYNHVSTCHGWTTTANQTCKIGRYSALPAVWSDLGARCATILGSPWWAGCGRPAYIQGSPDYNSGMHEKGTDGSYSRKRMSNFATMSVDVTNLFGLWKFRLWILIQNFGTSSNRFLLT